MTTPRPYAERPAARPVAPAVATQPPPPPPRKDLSFTWRVVLISVVAVTVIIIAAALFAGGGSTAGTAPCTTAMKTAADVVAMDNDAELLATLDECASASDWIHTVKEIPEAGGLLSYTTEEAESFLDSACALAVSSRVCVDAAEEGILTSELDDPPLDEPNP